MRRDFPIPASPANSRNWPRPAAASARRRSARSSSSSRPVRIGERRGLTRVMARIYAPCQGLHRSNDRWRAPVSRLRRPTGPAPLAAASVVCSMTEAARWTRVLTLGPLQGGRPVATFMDVHSGFVGVTAQQLKEAHERDLAIEGDEGVHFERAWLDPVAGKVFCLATGPSRDAVLRIHERAGHATN